TASSAGGTGPTSGGWCRSSAACCPTAPPIATCPAPSRTCRRRTTCAGSAPALREYRPAHPRHEGSVTALLARTRRLDADVDLLRFAGSDGMLFERGRSGVAGRGCAARVPWLGGDPAAAARAAAEDLASIDV